MESRTHSQRETVQNLIEAVNHTESQDVYYSIFTPKKIEKSVKQSTKNALDQIVKLDLYETLSTMIAILEECLIETNKDKCYLKLQEKIKTVCAELTSKMSEKKNDLSSLKNMRDVLIPGLQKLIDEITKQNVNDEIDLLSEEFSLWFHGLCWCLCIAITRHEIQALIAEKKNESQASVPHPVKTRNMQVPPGIKAALDKIANMDTEESFPAIIAVLNEMLKNTNDHLTLQNTRDAIQYSLTLFTSADAIQHKSLSERYKHIGDNKDKVIPGLETLVSKIKNIELSNEIVSSCQELAIWLEGLYLHTYRQQGTLKNGIVNKALQYATNNDKISTLCIAEFYQQAAIELESLLQDPLALDSSSIEIRIEPPVKPADAGTLDSSDMDVDFVEDIYDAKMPVDVLPSSHLDQQVSSKDEMQTDESEDYFEIEDRAQCFWKLLDEVNDCDNQNIKINSLYNAFIVYGLTENQKIRLNHLKQEIHRNFDAYEKNTYGKTVLGAIKLGFISSYFFHRTHSDTTNLIAKDIEGTNDPSKLLETLFALRSLLPKKRSLELASRVDDMLLGAYEALWHMRARKKESEIGSGVSYIKEQSIFKTPPSSPPTDWQGMNEGSKLYNR